MEDNNNKEKALRAKKKDGTRKTPPNIYSIILDLMYANALPRSVVVKHIMKEYNLSQVHSYRLIREAIDTIEELHKEDLDSDYTDLIEKYEDLYYKAILAEDLKTAKSILTDIMKLKGLGIVKQEVKHTGIEFNYVIPTNEEE